MTDRTELGILVIKPENAPSSTWLNLQHQLLQERPSVPAMSIGVWDAANVHELHGHHNYYMGRADAYLTGWIEYFTSTL